MTGLEAALGYLIDGVAGEPPPGLHPTVWMGRAAAAVERAARRVCRSPLALRWAGVALVLAVVGGAAAGAGAIVAAAGRFGGAWAEMIAAAGLISTAIARRGLGRAGRAVHAPLAAGELEEARRRLAEIVGRDTAHLPAGEVARGAVETVAENAGDAVVAPLFYAFLGGAPLALAYRAVNTLDAMVGYRDERYRHLGWAAARLDDLVNLLPARLTGGLMVLAAGLTGMDWRAAWRVMRRDARRHPSPNAGYPEAAAAGALGVRLGGENSYRGEASFRPCLAEGGRVTAPDDVLAAVRLMNVASHLALLLGLALCLGVAGARHLATP